MTDSTPPQVALARAEAEVERLRGMADEDIDYSDIPPLTREDFVGAVRGRFYRPTAPSEVDVTPVTGPLRHEHDPDGWFGRCVHCTEVRAVEDIDDGECPVRLRAELEATQNRLDSVRRERTNDRERKWRDMPAAMHEAHELLLKENARLLMQVEAESAEAVLLRDKCNAYRLALAGSRREARSLATGQNLGYIDTDWVEPTKSQP